MWVEEGPAPLRRCCGHEIYMQSSPEVGRQPTAFYGLNTDACLVPKKVMMYRVHNSLCDPVNPWVQRVCPRGRPVADHFGRCSFLGKKSILVLLQPEEQQRPHWPVVNIDPLVCGKFPCAICHKHRWDQRLHIDLRITVIIAILSPLPCAWRAFSLS